MRVAGNEHFLAPCPEYTLSPDAVISTVDMTLVRGAKKKKQQQQQLNR